MRDGIEDPFDTEGHALTRNVNETVVSDEPRPAEAPPDEDPFDTEGHGMFSNVNETVVSDEPPPDETPDDPGSSGA